jgi:hypothetical protein
MSQGTNQILFDSKAFSQMPSQYHGGVTHVENTTLNNPFSMNEPLMSTSEEPTR